MFEDLELNVAEPKGEALVQPIPTFWSICWMTTRRICSETSTKLCC